MRRMGLILSISLLLGACAGGLPGLRPLSYATPGEARLFVHGTRCIHEPRRREMAPLIAAVLTTAASVLLENFGTALTRGAEGGALPTAIATRNLQLDPTQVPRCVIMIRGAFEPTTRYRSPIDLAARLRVGTEVNQAEFAERLQSFNLPDVYRLDQLVELRLTHSENRRALTFVPAFVLVERSLDGSTNGTRDLSIQLKFVRVGAANPVGSAVVVPIRQIGTPVTVEMDENGRSPFRESPWFGTFHDAPPAAPATGAPSQPGAAGVQLQSTDAAAIPVTVSVTTVETRPTNQGLAFIAQVFNGVRPQINQAIAPLINEQTDATQDAAEMVKEAEADAAEGTARQAVAAYCAANAAARSEREVKAWAARVAQIRANAAARAIQRDPVFPTLVNPDIDAPDNQSVCAAL